MKEKNYSLAVLSISAFLKLVIFLAMIFLLAGKLEYWQGWVFIIHTLVLSIIILIVFRGKTELFKERIKPGPGMKWWDKIFWVFHMLLFFAMLIIGVLDSGRYMWSPELPLYVYILSYVALTVGYGFVLWAMWVNNYFSSVVRIQKDRGQKVVQDGPYKYVRHPGYVGVFFFAPTIPLVLGSLWALIPGTLYVIAIVIRTYLEDKMLHKELEGYKEYAKKVKYRLIPGIW